MNEVTADWRCCDFTVIVASDTILLTSLTYLLKKNASTKGRII